MNSNQIIKIHEKEIEEGNIEYKRFFENVTLNKLAHLSAQMNWRINEGNGEAHYYLGICDNGTICRDLTQERIDYSLDVIKAMVDNCNAYINTMTIHRVGDHIWFDIYVKRMPQYTAEYRILVKNRCIPNIDYIKTGKTNYHTIYHNNEKYLFFESEIPNIVDLIDFNIIIDNNMWCAQLVKSSETHMCCGQSASADCIDAKQRWLRQVKSAFRTFELHTPHMCCIDAPHITELIENILPYMKGNIIPNKKNIIFNIIEQHYVPSIGIILYGFLKDGYIEQGSIINNEWKVRSIHYNMKDCRDIIAPAIVSICVVRVHM